MRKPWNQPKGTEKDDSENSSFHLMALNDEMECIGVSRLQKNTREEEMLGLVNFEKKNEMSELEKEKGYKEINARIW